jgi:hypothetical protein
MLMRPAFIAFFIVSVPAAALANSPGQSSSTGEFVTTCGGIGTGGFVQGGESIFFSLARRTAAASACSTVPMSPTATGPPQG